MFLLFGEFFEQHLGPLALFVSVPLHSGVRDGVYGHGREGLRVSVQQSADGHGQWQSGRRGQTPRVPIALDQLAIAWVIQVVVDQTNLSGRLVKATSGWFSDLGGLGCRSRGGRREGESGEELGQLGPVG